MYIDNPPNDRHYISLSYDFGKSSLNNEYSSYFYSCLANDFKLISKSLLQFFHNVVCTIGSLSR